MGKRPSSRNHFYFNKRGQALLELMVFGAIVIMLLGLLVNYGLRYNYQQQAMQQVFRKALSNAKLTTWEDQPKSISNVLIKDIHTPEPASPFAMGSITPVSATASVTQDYQLSQSLKPDNPPVITAQDIHSLPEVVIEINGVKRSYKTAGFRNEYGVPEEALEKYFQVYGISNVDDVGETCLKYAEEDDPYYDPEYASEPVCEQTAKNLVIVDSCDGEIIDYSLAKSRCRQIMDKGACEAECNKDLYKTAETDCGKICSYDMQVPWYCAKLDQLFRVANGWPKAMGVQEDYTQETRMENVLRKEEGHSGISATDTINWQVDTKRVIVYRPLDDTSGSTASVEDKSNVQQHKTISW